MGMVQLGSCVTEVAQDKLVCKQQDEIRALGERIEDGHVKLATQRRRELESVNLQFNNAMARQQRQLASGGGGGGGGGGGSVSRGVKSTGGRNSHSKRQGGGGEGGVGGRGGSFRSVSGPRQLSY